MFKKILPFLIIFLGVLILYYPALSTYFSQDDFFHFKVSQTDGTLSGFINLLEFHSFKERGIAFYRPLSRELPFNIYYSVFGLNPIPFRIFIFLIHFINIYLVYIFTQKLFNKKLLSYFVSFFFGITGAHVAAFYYLAGGIQTLLATTFTLSTLLLFLKYLKTNTVSFKYLSYLTFIFGIISEEQALIIPFLLIGLILISNKKIKEYIRDLLPYFVMILIILCIEAFKIGFSSSEQQYKLVFNIKTAFNSMSWYSIWALGMPETLIDFVLPGFKLNPNLLRYWSNYYLFIFPSFFISVGIIIFSFISLLFKNKIIFKDKKFIFALIWFPLGLLPVILLPLHKSTHYLEISLPAFWIIIGFVTMNAYQRIKKLLIAKFFLVLFLISLVVLSSASAILGSTNYWAATRGKLAEKLIQDIKTAYPTLPKGAVLYFKNDPNYPFLIKEWGGTSTQANLILNGSDALQLLYKDTTIKVFYEDTDKLSAEDISKQKIYSLTAKIN